MSGFYYWLRTERPYTNSTAVLAELRKNGLAYAFGDRITTRTSDRGPDTFKGMVVCDGPNSDGKLGWWPDEQVWKQIPGTDIWCGMFTKDPPTPDILARAEMVTGEWISDDAGNKWLAAKARRYVEFDGRMLWDYNLPRRMTLSDDGTWQVGDVKPRYQRLWDLAMLYEAALADAAGSSSEDDDTIRFSFPEIDELAISALQINYRVGPIELDLLGVYDSAFRESVINVLLDNTTWQKWIKKKLQEQDQSGGSS